MAFCSIKRMRVESEMMITGDIIIQGTNLDNIDLPELKKITGSKALEVR